MQFERGRFGHAVRQATCRGRPELVARAKPALAEEREMARIAGIDLPREKRGTVAITYIYGLGSPAARKIFLRAGVDPNRRVKDWTEAEIAKLREIIEREHKVEGDLRREVAMNVKRLMDLGTYRGIRHRRGLPVRGQRTHTNARTRKGPRRGVMVKKKPAAAPGPAGRKAGG